MQTVAYAEIRHGGEVCKSKTQLLKVVLFVGKKTSKRLSSFRALCSCMDFFS